MRYELTDEEWAAIKPRLPNKPRGVPRVNDRRVLNGIFWVLRSGAPWRDLPEGFQRRGTSPAVARFRVSRRHRQHVIGRTLDGAQDDAAFDRQRLGQLFGQIRGRQHVGQDRCTRGSYHILNGIFDSRTFALGQGLDLSAILTAFACSS